MATPTADEAAESTGDVTAIEYEQADGTHGRIRFESGDDGTDTLVHEQKNDSGEFAAVDSTGNITRWISESRNSF